MTTYKLLERPFGKAESTLQESESPFFSFESNLGEPETTCLPIGGTLRQLEGPNILSESMIRRKTRPFVDRVLKRAVDSAKSMCENRSSPAWEVVSMSRRPILSAIPFALAVCCWQSPARAEGAPAEDAGVDPEPEAAPAVESLPDTSNPTAHIENDTKPARRWKMTPAEYERFVRKGLGRYNAEITIGSVALVGAGVSIGLFLYYYVVWATGGLAGECDPEQEGSCSSDTRTPKVGMISTALAGVACVAVGVPLVVVGARGRELQVLRLHTMPKAEDQKLLSISAALSSDQQGGTLQLSLSF
jgi:hypothetical protein